MRGGTRGQGQAIRDTAKEGNRSSAGISGQWLTWNNMYFTLKQYKIFVGVLVPSLRV